MAATNETSTVAANITPTKSYTPKTPKLAPITRETFRTEAKPLAVTVGGTPLFAMPKDFSTGSVGWSFNAKVLIEVDGKMCECQVGGNVTVNGSKNEGKGAAGNGGAF